MSSFLKLKGLIINTQYIEKVEETYRVSYRIYVTTPQHENYYDFRSDRDPDDYETIRNWIMSL
jgi:hypothetical protein